MAEYLPPFLMRARCCRDWPVGMPASMGRCGCCGQIPVVIGPWEEEECRCDQCLLLYNTTPDVEQ